MSIPNKMKAIVKTKKERGCQLAELTVPEIEEDEVLVKIHAMAICGTDIHAYQWNEWAQNNFERSFSALPRIMGHEFSGEVAKIGSKVTNVKIGQKVCSETHIPCGECYLCRTGNSYNCINMKRFKDGVYADYAVIPANMLIVLPDDMSYDYGTIIEPLSVATHACSQVRLVGDTAFVVGAGPIGLFVIAVAKSMGASTIFVSDVSKFRRDLAMKVGASYTFNPSETDVVQEIKKLTDGLGAGIVFDTSGNVRAIKQGFEALRKCGHICLIGLPSEPLVLEAANDIVWKAATVHGIYGKEEFTSWYISKSLLASKRICVDELITHRFRMSQFKEAFELAETGMAGKVILYPDYLVDEEHLIVDM